MPKTRQKLPGAPCLPGQPLPGYTFFTIQVLENLAR
jgi:hypothetical protein